MTTKFFRFLRGLYDPLLVLLVVGAAGVLLYALYHAVGGGRGDSTCFEAALDDVSGIKERSSVLFKGMPVGSVGVMKYDPATDKILVRIDIKKPRDIPANIKPYVESSLMGQSSIALRTETTATAPQLLADVVKQYQAKSPETLYRLDGVRLSRADSLMPGFDMRAQQAMAAASDAMKAASDAMVEMKVLVGDWRELSGDACQQQGQDGQRTAKSDYCARQRRAGSEPQRIAVKEARCRIGETWRCLRQCERLHGHDQTKTQCHGVGHERAAAHNT